MGYSFQLAAISISQTGYHVLRYTSRGALAETRIPQGCIKHGGMWFVCQELE